MSSITPYKGSTRRLVIAIDVGTTYSGVSYCILEPGDVPEIRSVSRYPGLAATKVPTVLYYDKEGELLAAGAQTLRDNVIDKAEEEKWIKVEWFKLRMRPKSLPMEKAISTTLPPKKSVDDVFADFLKYLMGNTETFIRETHAKVSNGWEDLRRDTAFIFAHPNGWEGPQQVRYRRAAVQAGLVPDSPQGRSRITFVTEGEASLHYCLRDKLIDDVQTGFVVADLGGGTLDFSVYKSTSVDSLRVEEIATPRCIMEGFTFVTQRASVYLEKKLKKSPYGMKEIRRKMLNVFDKTAGRAFGDTADDALIVFGNIFDKDQENDIHRGKLRIKYENMASFFEPSISAVVNTIKDIKFESSVAITAIYLVGGFSMNEYVAAQLTKRLKALAVSVYHPDGQTVKAVADGSISYFIDRYVRSRVVRKTYASRIRVPYDANDEELHQRRANAFKLHDGVTYVTGIASVLLKKGSCMSEDESIRRRFSLIATLPKTLQSFCYPIYAYAGSGDPPRFIEDLAGQQLYQECCQVKADLSHLYGIVQKRESLRTAGTKYTEVFFHVSLSFRGAELIAEIVWNENGLERRGAAEIIYEAEDDDVPVEEDEEGDDPVDSIHGNSEHPDQPHSD